MQALDKLVIAAQQGNKDSFGQIVNRFQDMAFASAYAMLGDVHAAQDAAQEAFIDAYLSLPNLREPAAFPGWFRRIIWKHGDRQLRGKSVTILPLEFAEEFRSPLPTPAEVLDETQRREDVHAALHHLPPEQRQIITLFYVEGYAQQEIAAFLELPVTTIKKRLFDARKKLKERMIYMVQEVLHTTRPSQNDQFATKIQFFAALLAGDVTHVERLVQQDSTLLTAGTEWEMQLGGYDWTLGATALHLSAARGDTAMAEMLLARGAKINATDDFGMAPLHVAIIMGQLIMAQILLRHGAPVNAQTSVGQTALHLAVQRKNVSLARLLLKYGAVTTSVDQKGLTPGDWAALKGASALIEILTGHRPNQPIMGAIPEKFSAAQSTILQTGIKVIDLLAPLQRGGRHGIFTPHPGIGLFTVLGQLIASLHELHGLHTVSLGLETGAREGERLSWSWRKVGVVEQLQSFYANVNDSPAQCQHTIEQGLAQVAALHSTGKDVLLLVDGRLAVSEGMLACLTNALSGPLGASTTLLIHGNFTAGAEPELLTDLDAVITFDPALAQQQLYPAIDRIWSRSRLLETGEVAPNHCQVAQAVRRLLRRYAELHERYEQAGSNAFWYIQDDPHLVLDIACARRLQNFLTQPFTGAEPWSGVVGQHVALADTIAGCQMILTGQYNALPEEAFRFVGTIEQAIEKAKQS